MKSWILIGDSLCEVPIPSSIPGLKSSPDVWDKFSCLHPSMSSFVN